MFTPEQAEELKKLIDKNTVLEKAKKPHRSILESTKVKLAAKYLFYNFSWDSTTEGCEYWNEVVHKLEHYLNISRSDLYD